MRYVGNIRISKLSLISNIKNQLVLRGCPFPTSFPSLPCYSSCHLLPTKPSDGRAFPGSTSPTHSQPFSRSVCRTPASFPRQHSQTGLPRVWSTNQCACLDSLQKGLEWKLSLLTCLYQIEGSTGSTSLCSFHLFLF